MEILTISRQTVVEDDNLGLAEASGISTIYLGMNVEREFFADKELRKAIIMGINRDDIINSLLMGAVAKANSFLASSVFGYSADSKVYEYNP